MSLTRALTGPRAALAALLLGGLAACQPALRPPAPEEPPTAEPRETVVLIHGLWRGNGSMWLLAQRLEDAGFNVVRVGFDTFGATPEDIVAEVAEQIDACCTALPRAVHLVGHSMGGLAIRAYLAERRLPGLGRVVQIGSPNSGTPIVDEYQDAWWMDLAGPTAKALGTDAESFPASLPPPDYPVGIIAGVRLGSFRIDLIDGEDDGLVPVESTKVQGMTDFIVVETGHAMMRYNEEVAMQTIAFLRHGRFVHGS